MGTRMHCPDCFEGLFSGSTGHCRHCDGTGTNTQLDAENPKCPYCEGTGKCSTCQGTGIAGGQGGGNEIQTLFGS
jgi:hypothetical protein